MNIFYRVTIVFSALILTACQPSVVPDASHADLVFTNGTIYTVDSKTPWAEAVAVKDGEIIYVGGNDGAKRWIDENTKLQDIKGKMLLPGFIDSHAHPVSGGAYVRSLSLDTFSNPQGWLQQIAEFAKQNPDAQVLFGYGFLASAFGENGPTSKMLDSVVSDRPVFLMDEGFHGGWGNTKAVELLGINKNTPDPAPGFSYYKRDKNGQPSGYFLEGTASLAIDKLAIITSESVALGTTDVIQIMNSYGITSVFDAGALDVDSMQVDVLNKITEQGNMSIRYIGSHMIASTEGMETAVEITTSKKAASQNEKYQISMLKIMNDGTVEGKTAGMNEDYQGEPGNRGETVFTQEQLNDLVKQASSKNIDIHIHALGERTITESLNAIEEARSNNSKSTSRYTICHVQVITDDDVKRFAELRVIAQSTPLWASFDEYGKAFVSDDQFHRYFRFNSLKEAGVKMSFGSDYPASGAGTLGMSPIYNMEVGHTRQSVGKPNAAIQPNKSERLDIATLIKGYTLDGAYQLHLEDEIGSIAVGKKADFVLLDKNLFEVAPYEIHKVEVLQTIMDGKTVYLKP